MTHTRRGTSDVRYRSRVGRESRSAPDLLTIGNRGPPTGAPTAGPRISKSAPASRARTRSISTPSPQGRTGSAVPPREPARLPATLRSGQAPRSPPVEQGAAYRRRSGGWPRAQRDHRRRVSRSWTLRGSYHSRPTPVLTTETTSADDGSSLPEQSRTHARDTNPPESRSPRRRDRCTGYQPS